MARSSRGPPIRGRARRWLATDGLAGKQGKPGERGSTGPAGPPGRDAPVIVQMNVDEDGLIRLINSAGSEVTCDLYPVLAKLGR